MKVLIVFLQCVGARAGGPQLSGRPQVLEPCVAGDGAPEGTEQADRLVRQCVAAAHEVAARGVLLRVTFETLFEYLAVRVSGAATWMKGLRPIVFQRML